MKAKMFSVWDCKAEAYITPFFSQTTATAIRSFATAANAEDHQFARFGADFTLFELGEWDDNSGKFEEHRAAINLGTALSMREQPTFPIQGGE